MSARVLALAVEIAGPIQSPAGADATTPLGERGFHFDSLGLLELVAACERTFDIDFDPHADLTLQTLESVGSLAALIRAKRR